MKKLLYWAIWLIGITACVNPKGKEVLAEAERLVQASPELGFACIGTGGEGSHDLFAPQPHALPVASSRGDEQGLPSVG